MADDDLDSGVTRTTYYGYEQPGDPDYDSGSAAGLGDRDNSLIPGYSAALTQSERLARFGVTGKSTGQEFEWDGKIFRDDDSTADWLTDRRVDIYSPSGPGRDYAEAESNVGLSDEEMRQKYLGFLPDYPEQPDTEEKPEEKQPEKPPDEPPKSFIEKFRDKFPIAANLSDDDIIQKYIQPAFPNIPIDDLAVYAKDKNAAKLVKDAEAKPKTPLENYKDKFPDFVQGKSDEDLTHLLYDKLKPKDLSFDQFKDKLIPPKPHVNAAEAGMNAALQNTLADVDRTPKTIADLWQLGGLYGWEKSADEWMRKNVPGYAGADDFYQQFAKNAADRADQFDKQAQAQRESIPKDFAGQAMGLGGEIAGSLPGAAISFGLGSTGRAAALWGMAWDGTTAYGRAVEEHQKNALSSAVESASMRGFSQFLMNTGMGRIASGFSNAVASVGEEEVQKWLRGEPNDITKDSKSFANGLIIGLFMGGHGEDKSGYRSPEEAHVEDHPLPEEPGIAPETEFIFHKNGAVNEEVTKAHDYHQNGDTDKASDHLDRGLALMTNGEKQELTQRVIQKVEELGSTREPAEPVKTEEVPKKPVTKPEDDIFNGYFFSGLPIKPEDIDKALFAVAEGIGKEGSKYRELFSPEKYGGEESELAGAIVKAEKGRTAGMKTMVQSEIAKRSGIEAKLKGGTESKNRMNYFDKFSSAERVEQFIDYQEGRTLKDPTAEWIWRNVLGPIYESINKRDEANNVVYEHRDNYFFQLLSHPKDELPRLLRDVSKQTGGQSFVKPRQMTLVERLALGHKMFTDNPERLMQMRWAASDRAIEKINVFRELEKQGLVYRADDPNIPYEAKNWPQEATAEYAKDPKTGEPTHKINYHVKPSITPVINNAFDFRSVRQAWQGVLDTPFKVLGVLKGAVGLKLQWSLFHPLHIAQIAGADIATEGQRRILLGVANRGDVINAATAQMPGVGLLHVWRGYKGMADEINVLKGKGDYSKLTAGQKENVKMFMDMGLKAEENHERQMQFQQFLTDQLPKDIRDRWRNDPVATNNARIGYNILSSEWFSKWWFGELTPRIKMASAVMRRDTLFKTNPELFRPENRAELLKEYQKINRDIEGRYGEMNYDTLLWPNIAKEVGTHSLLSLGWQIGFMRTNGDAVIDMTHNATHMKEIFDQAKMYKKPVLSQILTNRILNFWNYNAAQLVLGAAITYAFTKSIPTLWDMVFPRVGKDDKGHDKRVVMQGFMREFPAIGEYVKESGSWPGGIAKWALNKLNPTTMAALQAVFNKDYMGKPIGNLQEQIGYWFRQAFLPISVEQDIKVLQQGGNLGDLLMAHLGFSPSARWTTKSQTEQNILKDYLGNREVPPDIIQGRDAYARAYNSGNAQELVKARSRLEEIYKKEGRELTPRIIKNIESESHLTSEQKLFKHLQPTQQIQRLKEMSPKERDQYLPNASKKVQEMFEDEMLTHP